jgi:cytochrome c peroxidase
MGRKTKVWIGLLGALSALGLLSALLYQPGPGAAGPSVFAAVNPAGLRADLQEWSARHAANGGDHNVLISLGWAKGLSRENTHAVGLARLDLVASAVQVELQGLPAGNWDVWMVHNQPGGSVVPEPGDRMHRLGRVATDGKLTRLSTRLEPGFFDRFHADLMVVTRAGARPETGGVLFGSPDLFQRLYTKAQAKPALRASHTPMLASLFGPRVATATAFDSTDALVAQGFQLFFNEKFGGNGRTCGTCHPSDNNFTIDPNYIATQPPDDPLFVAETNPALAQNFENPTLMRALGLVVENPDGFDNLATKFVLRGVPHLLGLRNSRSPIQPGSPNPPAERLGWAGDGAPGAGTIRDFAVGAIIQHFTKTLNRVPGTDFRLPTSGEMDALAAFQLALGRQADPNLPAMQFRSPVVTRGQAIYLALDTVGGTVVAGKCNACHGNGGALGQSGDNRNFNIGTEDLADHPADLIMPGARPRDGGFGRAPNPHGGFGNGRFNTPVVIEAADTGPFFHNDSAATIEEAVAFYNSNAFNNSEVGLQFKAADTGGIGIHLESTQVEAVAALLRVLNALENIRSSTELDEAAQSQHDDHQAQMLLDLASFDTRDAIRVLEERGLHLDAVAKLKQAYDLEHDGEDDHGDHGNDHKSKKDDHGGGDGGDNGHHDRFTQILQLKADAKAAMIVTP